MLNVRRTIGIPQEAHEKLIGLQADAMKTLKRQVSLGEVVSALIEYARSPHEGPRGASHHLVWTDRMAEGESS